MDNLPRTRGLSLRNYAIKLLVRRDRPCGLRVPEKRRIEGVLLHDSFGNFELQTYDGPAGINAAAATEQEWKTVRKIQPAIVNGQRWLTFAPEETRALRVRIAPIFGRRRPRRKEKKPQ